MQSVTACLLKNEPTSWYILPAKPFKGGAIGKPSVNSAYVVSIRPETRASLSWAGWTLSKDGGRTEHKSRAILCDDLW